MRWSRVSANEPEIIKFDLSSLGFIVELCFSLCGLTEDVHNKKRLMAAMAMAMNDRWLPTSLHCYTVTILDKLRRTINQVYVDHEAIFVE